MLEKLYTIKLPLDDRRKKLYIQGNFIQREEHINIEKGKIVDLGTYFNAFSVKKWKQYTSLEKLQLHLFLHGEFYIEVYGIYRDKEKILIKDCCKGNYIADIGLQGTDMQLVGVRLKALSEEALFSGGEYRGRFADERDIKIGITICTFKREKYLFRNLKLLENLVISNPDFNILVIDNGRTIEQKNTDWLRIIHNPNFGGSGGFARGLIEQVNQGENNYVLLMDDDILIETSALERLYSLCRHMREMYRGDMISGAMLSMDRPCIQFENTAYWGRIRMHASGRGFDLTNQKTLWENENLPQKRNRYGAWWFCCIPLETVKKNGYPLPVFIKGDDIEYGLRSRCNFITMNGIGVWHETFIKKQNVVMEFFNDRNMLIINHYAEGCNRWTFLFAVFGRFGRRILRGNTEGIRRLELAIRDHGSGLEGITAVPSDEKFRQVQNYHGRKNILLSLGITFLKGMHQFLFYGTIDKTYKEFREKKLRDQAFWRKFLGIE